MKMPGADNALISTEKVVCYLLNPDHPDGASKAKVLAHAGFDRSRPEELEEALRTQHLGRDARLGKSSAFGTKYEVSGPSSGPQGTVMATSVWMIRHGESFPRLITLVPEPGESS
ncbi:MAG TPA: hypothetical protein VMY37_07440 [Thermoguttaceae bacterium]|nr:hypothetical protein [Thermoguttaceae bacterium]